jgi:hypothetical protein
VKGTLDNYSGLAAIEEGRATPVSGHLVNVVGKTKRETGKSDCQWSYHIGHPLADNMLALKALLFNKPSEGR